MRKGLVISASLHAAILFWAVAVFPDADDLNGAEPTPIPVELVTPDELTKIKAGDKKADKKTPQSAKKPEETKQAKKETKKDMPERKVARAPEPPSEPVEPAPKAEKAPPAPAPKPEPEKKVENAVSAPMPSRKPRAAPKFTEPLKPKPEPKQKRTAFAQAKPKKKNFDPDSIAALLNKAPDAGERNPVVAEKPEPKEPEQPMQGLTQGRDLRMTFSEIDALRARISQCWNPPVGGLGAEELKVKLRLQLTPDGMLASRPEVVNRGASPFFQAAADSAVRAVMLCQPYSLPADKFALWRDMILNFDPKEMFRG